MKRAKLQYAIKSKQQVTKLRKISKIMINYKIKDHKHAIVQSSYMHYRIIKQVKCLMFIYLHRYDQQKEIFQWIKRRFLKR
jgi:hypothetical protein